MSNELEQIKQKQKELDELIARLESKRAWIPSYIDQPVYVRDSKNNPWELRFVANTELNIHRELVCWSDVNTSLTTVLMSSWKYWKPAIDIITTPNWLPNTGVMPDCKRCVMRCNDGAIANSTNPAGYDWDISENAAGIKEFFVVER